MSAPDTNRPDARLQPDWTVHPETGHANSSPEFVRVVSEVEQLIRDDAYALIGGRANATARLIVAQLAHKHGLAPRADIGSSTVESAP